MNQKLSNEKRQEIVDRYINENIHPAILCLDYNIKSGWIYQILKDNNVKLSHKKLDHKKTYPLNEHYFDIIDTEEKAYFLGLLAADGSINKNHNCFEIALQEQDCYILDKLRNALNSEHPLYFKDLNNKNTNWQNSIKLHINGRHITEQLIKLGIPNKKSMILEFPQENQVPTNMLNYYVRGMFDGNGRILNRFDESNCYVACDITTTIMFAEKLSDILLKKFNINTTNRQKINGNNITTDMCIEKSHEAIKFLGWIYKDSKLHLIRKFDKYLWARHSMFFKNRITEQELIDVFKNNYTDDDPIF